ncbi:hypothetical protein SAMN04487947_2727 [Halogeometricum rufum]|uniref:Halobacterial output domain-containing protein n=1 Tax=Halogeometricum rufum TaxID=553469 RepID=A0A1I6I1I7_9EURY|nr:HalOD1 output domain-containing protein [Halogeometricum rufum]SFR60320.1 hypothetical protein SAMN04487947_2727 [Halogeometricum rufum]
MSSYVRVNTMADDRPPESRTPAPYRSLTDLRYDEQAGLYRARYDPASARELFVDVVLAVSDVLGVDTCELEPAYETIDPDAFDTLVDSYATNAGVSGGSLSFRLDDCVVTVRRDELAFERRAT